MFQDSFTGIPGSDLAAHTPDAGGAAWVGAGVLSFGEFKLAAPDGAEDVGPNSRLFNAAMRSALLQAFPMSALAPGDVLHLRVTMANLSSTPATNPFESTRVDLATDGDGTISLGELLSGGNWGVARDGGAAFASSVSTAQSGDAVLDLYLDPDDAYGDGAGKNAFLRVNNGCPIAGFVPGLTTGTTVNEVRLVRNVDDEVRYRGLLLETTPAAAPSQELFRDDLAGTAGAPLIGTVPEAGGAAWIGAGYQPSGEFAFGPAPELGVRDIGPNARTTNASVRSPLLPGAYALSALPMGKVLHLRVTMANLAANPAVNVFESTRVDLAVASGGLIGLGEFVTGGFWGAGVGSAAGFRSQVATTTANAADLDLYLDPNDELRDGPWLNAAVRVNDGCLVVGHLSGLDCNTAIAEVRLVRNVDDEVSFKDLLLETSDIPPSTATTLFRDDLDGPLGGSIEGTPPEEGGNAWTPGGQEAGGQFKFAENPPGGVADEGPNNLLSNSYVSSVLASPFTLSGLGPNEVLHLKVRMQNLDLLGAGNPLESSRVDLMTSTSGIVALGEFLTGGNWGAGSEFGPSAASNLSTVSSPLVDLDLYLDPRDAFQDAIHNARVQVAHGVAIPFEIPNLSLSTVINEVRLVRNVDDAVRFDDVLLERVCMPMSATLDAPEAPPVNIGERLSVEPNPFHGATRIRLALPETGDVHVAMYDLAGRCVRTLQDGRLAAGEHVFAWDGADTQGHRVAAGVYFARLRSQGRAMTVQAVRLR